MKRTDSRGGVPMQMHGRKDLKPQGVPGFTAKQIASMARKLRADQERNKAVSSVLAEQAAYERKLNR